MTKKFTHLSSKPIATWLLVGVGMLIIQILLGGLTRLTGSGLSITEWNVVTGTLPPLNEQQWLLEFEKYKLTPQFHLLNFDFTLQNFKHIFFWEWFHRFWARLMGIVFLIPFIIFLLQRRFKPAMVRPMIILFLLGAVQGVVGWIMVASGLTGDAIYVKPVRLALHFIFALGLLCYTFWFALKLLIPAQSIVIQKRLANFNFWIIVVLVLQLLYGALMAGHKAATAAPTWPSINGYFIPPQLMNNQEGIMALVDHKIVIHFMHRGLAYLLLLLILFFTYRLFKITGSRLYRQLRWLPLTLTILQILLGIAAVLSSVGIIPGTWGLFEWMAQLHQLVAMCLLLSLVALGYLIRKK